MIQVGVIFGGATVEHEVSIISALQGIAALDKSKYEVIPLYLSKKRQLFSDPALCDIEVYKDLDELEKKYEPMCLIKEESQVFVRPIHQKLFSAIKPREIDVVIPIVHGTNTEDGSVAGYLETLGVAYGGCDVKAGAVGQDKVFMHHILQNSGLPVVDWFWFYFGDFKKDEKEILKKAEKLGYPVVVKPACLGSSVGIEVVVKPEGLKAAILEAGQYDAKIVIEKAVVNLREINASVLGDSASARVSVLEEVGKSEAILSYKDKYLGQGKKSGNAKGMVSASRIVPAPISEKQKKHIEDLALKTFRALDCAGVCRIDFLMDGVSEKIYVNEINTCPGSLAYYLWTPLGVSFTQLMDELVQLAIARKRRQAQMIFSYDTNILAGYKPGAKGAKKL
ncbi:MAG: D-alanine--D-alanine ligase [Erysipelotrichaceae bacterium]|jgi:D-alanine-D-alanine ligase|nr:D-alanine--D-alanine ligase [Erysipelotrichaceae bacterium]